RRDPVDRARPIHGGDRRNPDRRRIAGLLVDTEVGIDIAADARRHDAVRDRVREDTAAVRVRPTTVEPTCISECLQRGDEPLPPPGTTLRHRSYSSTALVRSAMRSRKASLSNSVSQDSSVPTMAAARPFFSSIIASIRSSTVPTATNLWTKTFL